MICQRCGTELSEGVSVCWKCGQLVDPELAPTAGNGPSPPAVPAQATAQPPPEDVRGTGPPGGARPARTNESSGSTGANWEGMEGSIDDGGEVLTRLAKEGADLYVVAGLSQHGKSEFMYSLRRAVAQTLGGSQSEVSSVQTEQPGAINRTPRGKYFAWRIPDRRSGRRFVVWDIAGEDFEEVTRPHDGDSTQARPVSEFLRKVLPQCRGVMLALSLPKLWSFWNDEKERALIGTPLTASATLEANLNSYMKFLEFAQVARARGRRGRLATGSSDQWSLDTLQREATTAPLLDIPVLVTFSMTDACERLRTPPLDAPPYWKHSADLPSVTLDLTKVDPLAMAFLYLPALYSHLLRHVRWFKFDCSRAFQSGGIGKRQDDGRRTASGCLSAFQFLSEMNWRGSFWSTKRYIALHSRINRTEWQQCLAEAHPPYVDPT